MDAHELDVVAMQQDAASIHVLATRALGEVDMHDPAVALLAAWVAEIDDGVDGTVRFVLPNASSRGSTPIAASTARGRRTALIAGSTVLALVVSGGAAAAVTGDPLALVRAPLHAMAKVNPFAGDDTNAREQLPNQTPNRAKANKLLADARRAMADGDPAKAQSLLTEATALLGGAANPGQQNRIDKLTGDLPGQSGAHQNFGHDPQGKGPRDTGSQGNQGNQGPSGSQGKGPGDTGSQGNKGPKGSNGSADPKGKRPGDTSTTRPSAGTSKGGSSKPRQGGTSADPKGPPSSKPTKVPRANGND